MTGATSQGKAGRRGWALAGALLLAVKSLGAQATSGPDTRYAQAAAALERFIEHEMVDKALPALSIALVDGDRIVWARGFGFLDSLRTKPATAQTVYRVGSVSKLFTDIGVMQLVEQGALDLDAPVTRYLPDFRPHNPFGKAITLRQLMSHRSGLVREPPVGNYFEPGEPSLARTVASINTTALVFPPEQRIKYSNAAIAVVGYVLERTQREPFAAYLKRRVLDPLGMSESTFDPTPQLLEQTPQAIMWTQHGRTFSAPTFRLGMAPAGSMYSTMPDLARFLSAMFRGGEGVNGRVLQDVTLKRMWEPQFAAAGASGGVGLGFIVGTLDGQRVVRHGGTIYGFATELVALPDAKLGVVISSSKDVTNGVVSRIATEAVRVGLAARAGTVFPDLRVSRALTREEALRLAGTYGTGDRQVELVARDTSLFLEPARGDFRSRLRWLGRDSLVTDGEVQFGTAVVPVAQGIVVGGDTLARTSAPDTLALVPRRWRGLMGEYGWDHNGLSIYEKHGRLTARIDWFAEYPLREVGPNEFAFPDYGLFAGERLRFARLASGRASHVTAASVRFARRTIPGEDAAVFRITPTAPVATLRNNALAASPPVESGTFRESDLVELTSLDASIKLDIRYASRDNFLSTPVYSQARAFLQRPAAEALVRAHQQLKALGYGLLIHDGYRPWYVTKMFWDGTPVANHVFVADPSRGSRHNRGCAVDLTMYNLRTGKPVIMTGGYDEMSDRSYPDYPGGTSGQRALRELLRATMEANDFRVFEAEWWHFDYKDWRSYRIGNQRFEEISTR